MLVVRGGERGGREPGVRGGDGMCAVDGRASDEGRVERFRFFDGRGRGLGGEGRGGGGRGVRGGWERRVYMEGNQGGR